MLRDRLRLFSIGRTAERRHDLVFERWTLTLALSHQGCHLVGRVFLRHEKTRTCAKRFDQHADSHGRTVSAFCRDTVAGQPATAANDLRQRAKAA